MGMPVAAPLVGSWLRAITCGMTPPSWGLNPKIGDVSDVSSGTRVVAVEMICGDNMAPVGRVAGM